MCVLSARSQPIYELHVRSIHARAFLRGVNVLSRLAYAQLAHVHACLHIEVRVLLHILPCIPIMLYRIHAIRVRECHACMSIHEYKCGVLNSTHCSFNEDLCHVRCRCMQLYSHILQITLSQLFWFVLWPT